MLKDHQDAYGHAVWDRLHGKPSLEIVERDDGWIDLSLGPGHYLAEYKDWLPFEKKAIKHARGRVLDIGCGPGRVLLHLNSKGMEGVGIDNSPLAIKTAKARGLKDVRVMPITRVDKRLGIFDTVVMFGNNFGLMGSFQRARWLLRRFHRLTTDRGRIIAASTVPYDTDIPEHKWYHRYNRRRGRMGGQLRLRVRYKKYATPFFDYLLVSKAELDSILHGTGWKVTRYIESGSAPYIAVIDKD